VLIDSLDDQLGPSYEQAFRDHLRAEAAAGRVEPNVVAVGPWWQDRPPVEIDAVMLTGRNRKPPLVGESKSSTTLDARRPLKALQDKAAWLVADPSTLRYALCAREHITNSPDDVLAVTAEDILPT
jgi:hypothetical protein